jgi:hypothetical protein
MVTNDCIGNYMFLDDHSPCHLRIAPSSSAEHYSDEEIVVFDDHKLISREPESDHSSSKGTIMAEQEFFVDQHVFDLPFKYLVAAFMESYFPENLEISNFFISHMFLGEYGFLNEFLSLLLHFINHVLIGDKDKVLSILKLLEWLLWKSAFT